MIVIYRPSTGEIVDNTGTNSLWPYGFDDEELAWLNIPDRTGLRLLRLHDVDDASAVAAVLRGAARVMDREIVIDDAAPTEPTPTPPSTPSVEELIARIESMQAWAAQMQAQADALTDIVMGGPA